MRGAYPQLTAADCSSALAHGLDPEFRLRTDPGGESGNFFNDHFLFKQWYGFHRWGYLNSWMVYNGKSQSEMDALGVPPFQETSVYIYIWIYCHFYVYIYEWWYMDIISISYIYTQRIWSYLLYVGVSIGGGTSIAGWFIVDILSLLYGDISW